VKRRIYITAPAEPREPKYSGWGSSPVGPVFFVGRVCLK